MILLRECRRVACDGEHTPTRDHAPRDKRGAWPFRLQPVLRLFGCSLFLGLFGCSLFFGLFGCSPC